MPKIDIIIPAYNAEKTIEACLFSLFRQSFTDFKITLVNDGSTDQTLERLKAYTGRIQIITQQNAGAAAARNRGAQAVSAPYIIFVDADIVAFPTLLEKMYQTLQIHPEAAYSYSAFKFGHKKFRLWPFSAERLKKMPYIHTTSLIRREHFSGFDERLKRFQDWDLWLTMLSQQQTGHFIPEVLFKVKAGGTMSSWLPGFMYQIPFLNKHRQAQAYKNAEQIIKTKHGLS